jgi:ribosomal-protein-alanine N-acetyltransferase
METKDLDRVMMIETLSNEFYLTKEDMVEMLRRKNVVVMVALKDESVDSEIVGFIIYELMSKRIQVLDMAIHPNYRRMGYGKTLIDKLKDKLSIKKRIKISTEVRESNLSLQLFLKSQNFIAHEILKDYFEDTKEDGYIMQYSLSD